MAGETTGVPLRDGQVRRDGVGATEATMASPTSGPAPRRGRGGRTLRALGLLALLMLPVLGALAGYAVTLVTPPKYTAEAYVLISSTGGANEVTPGDIAQAVARVATSESVIAAGSSDSLVEAAREDHLTSNASPDAPLVELSATASSASTAAQLANDLANAVELHMSSNAQVEEVSASTFASASAPAEPSSPNLVVNVAAGAALGLLLASVGLVLRRR